MPVTFHSLEEASTVPESVKKLEASLQTPLRGKQKLEALPSMTPLALAQLQRVQDQAGDTCSTADSFDTISSVANLVLITTAAIEQLVGEVDGLEARSMIPHWYTLLRTIARASRPDSRIIGETPFVYPRGFDGEEGVAEMLMTFAADKAMVSLNLNPEHSEQTNIDNTSSACAGGLRALVKDDRSMAESGVGESSHEDENSGDEDDWEYDEEYDYTEESYDEARDHPIYSAEPAPLVDIRAPDEAELFFGLDVIDEHELPEETWLDLPHCSHILAGSHSGPVVLFPVLCVASETEIVLLMASAAYQRHAWGVDLPIVVLDISTSSCSARVYISWVDPLSDVQHMPTVHIIHTKLDAAMRTSDVLVLPGSFDLANPQSALALAHSIFSLSYQFDILQQELPSRCLCRFTWRSDDDATLWAGSIEEWRAHINESDESSLDASDAPSPITPKDTDTFTMPPKPPRSTASDRGRKRGQSRAVSSTAEGASSTLVLIYYNILARLISSRHLGHVGGDHIVLVPDKPKTSEHLPHIFVMLPQLLGKYKMPSELETKALNQARMYCFLAIFFYAHMKIVDYPVFGFAHHGEAGALVMGWMSCNGPIQAFHLACIILRLKARDAELTKKFEEAARGYMQDLSNGKFTQWYADEPVKPAKPPPVAAAASTSSTRASSAAASRGTSLERIPESDGH
ncbi:hypothetical protein EIP86_000721 [Pleurotus ostreatoroseus]|nr:hypothetical protein EIP86_000721 [Pleurotus ostreatoroseus]